MTNGPLISSPTVDRRAARMASTVIEDVVRGAAVEVAGRLVEPLRDALQRGGGSSGVAGAVRVYNFHTNTLVMRERGSAGDVIVGVGGESPHSDEAEELEWGGLYEGPRAWVRGTTGRLGTQVTTMWSNELTRELDRRCS